MPLPDRFALPGISAQVRGDATGDITIDGVTLPVQATDDAGVREEILRRVAAHAARAAQPIHVVITDDDGQWPLVVHPDGRIDSAGDMLPPPPATHAAVPTGRRAARAAAAQAAPPEAPSPVGAHADVPLGMAAPVSAVPVSVAPDSAVPVSAVPPATPTVEPEPEPEPEPEEEVEVEVVEEEEEEEEKPKAESESESEIPSSDVVMPPPVSAALPAPLSAAVLTETQADAAPMSRNSPNLADFLGSRPVVATGPAEHGWQGAVTRATGGLITFPPGSAEQAERTAIASVQRSLTGPRTIVVLNPKGGAHKTTATLLIAATFGIYRGGFTLAWDNNETMGTLGVRARGAEHTNTAVDLLRDLRASGDERATRVGDLDKYVRAQGDAQFDALASDLDPAGAASIDAAAFSTLHETLSRFYRVLVVDTGNNMRASNWEAAVEAADQLVIVSTIREDTGFGAAALIDGLRRKGHGEKVAEAVTILASPSKTVDAQLSQRLHTHFTQLTRTVLDVPFDASLVSGGPLNVDALAPGTRAAWLLATASIAEGL